jgi:superfamily II DNA/RNA helicase
VQKWWEEHEIMVSGNGSDKLFPVMRFQDAGFPADLLECTQGFQKPTPIQSQVRACVPACLHAACVRSIGIVWVRGSYVW